MCHFCLYFVKEIDGKQLFFIAYMVKICMIKLAFS